jgi:hypothetical protein
MRVTRIKNSGDQGWNEKGSPFSGEPPFVAWEFYLRRASISHLFIREWRVEVPKELKKIQKRRFSGSVGARLRLLHSRFVPENPDHPRL